MEAGSDPRHLSWALSDLIAMRGLARSRGDAQLAEIWQEAAGNKLGGHTRVAGIRRGVLQVGVSNSALLSELISFHKPELIEKLQTSRPDLGIRDIKFKLNGRLGRKKS